jgi:hypothetical protein
MRKCSSLGAKKAVSLSAVAGWCSKFHEVYLIGLRKTDFVCVGSGLAWRLRSVTIDIDLGSLQALFEIRLVSLRSGLRLNGPRLTPQLRKASVRIAAALLHLLGILQRQCLGRFLHGCHCYRLI